jgi:hypothetical protein
MKILVFTRSFINEPPRLRHQVAQLLLNAGHDIVFSEKPKLLPDYLRFDKKLDLKIQHQLKLIRPTEIIHHQLRIIPFLHYLNTYFIRQSLKKKICIVSPKFTWYPDLVINFNYDAYWLKTLFSDVPVSTIINDDFESLSRLPFKHHISWALRRTCESSDKVFAVSQPLVNRLSAWCNAELFLPWAAVQYQSLVSNSERNVLLFWGFINERLDIAAFKQVAHTLHQNDLRIRFVGPIIDRHGQALYNDLSSCSSIEWVDTQDFNSLKTDDCLAALIPYRIDSPGVEAIQLSNKALQLLSRGLPLIISPMPHFEHASFIYNYGTSEYPNIIQAALKVREQFNSLQPEIMFFVNQHGPEARLRQLLNS